MKWTANRANVSFQCKWVFDRPNILLNIQANRICFGILCQCVLSIGIFDREKALLWCFFFDRSLLGCARSIILMSSRTSSSSLSWLLLVLLLLPLLKYLTFSLVQEHQNTKTFFFCIIITTTITPPRRTMLHNPYCKVQHQQRHSKRSDAPIAQIAASQKQTSQSHFIQLHLWCGVVWCGFNFIPKWGKKSRREDSAMWR